MDGNHARGLASRRVWARSWSTSGIKVAQIESLQNTEFLTAQRKPFGILFAAARIASVAIQLFRLR